MNIEKKQNIKLCTVNEEGTNKRAPLSMSGGNEDE